MVKADQIPDEVAFALLDIYTLWLGDTDQARAAIAAALNAWLGSYSLAENDSAEIRGVAAIILPLPQDARDE